MLRACLKCGSRWRRTWEGRDDAEIPQQTTEDAKNMIDRRGRAFPKYLPAPRGRPEQGPREVEINRQGQAKVILRQGEASTTTTSTASKRGQAASSEEDKQENPTAIKRELPTGLRPARRAKTPTGTRPEAEIHEIYTDDETFDEVMPLEQGERPRS